MPWPLVPAAGQRRSWYKNASIIVLRVTVSRRGHTGGSPKVPQEGNEAREPRFGVDGGDVSGRPTEAARLLALLLVAVTAPGHGQDIGQKLVGAWYGVEGIDPVTNEDARTVITAPLEAEASAQIKCWPNGAFNVLVLSNARLPPGVGDTSVTVSYRFDRGVPSQGRAYLILCQRAELCGEPRANPLQRPAGGRARHVRHSRPPSGRSLRGSRSWRDRRFRFGDGSRLVPGRSRLRRATSLADGRPFLG